MQNARQLSLILQNYYYKKSSSKNEKSPVLALQNHQPCVLLLRDMQTQGWICRRTTIALCMGKSAFLSSPLEDVPPIKLTLHAHEKVVWSPGSPETELQSPVHFWNFWLLPVWSSWGCLPKCHKNSSFGKRGPDTFFWHQGDKTPVTARLQSELAHRIAVVRDIQILTMSSVY